MRFGVFLPPQALAAACRCSTGCPASRALKRTSSSRPARSASPPSLAWRSSCPIRARADSASRARATAYDFGLGAGFYVDATRAAVVARLPHVLVRHAGAARARRGRFAVDATRTGIFGHSMGGHGALTIALKNPDRYRSVSAFAPIASPMRCPWGEKALTGYLGADRARWRDYDATALIEDRGWNGPPMLVDQGTSDPFLERQLQARAAARRVQRVRRGARPAPARRLRPQLFLHRDVHRGSPAVSRPPPRRVKCLSRSDQCETSKPIARSRSRIAASFSTSRNALTASRPARARGMTKS